MDSLDDVLDHCNQCGYMQKQSKFKCFRCNYEANHKNDMRKHVRRYFGDIPFQCSYCDFKSVNKSSLLIHIRKHTREKPYFCNVCSYKSSNMNTIKRHYKIRHE